MTNAKQRQERQELANATARKLICYVSSLFGIDPEPIIKGRRLHTQVLVRSIVVKLLREQGYPLTTIATSLNRKGHQQIMYLLNEFPNKLQKSKAMKQNYILAKKELEINKHNLPSW